MNAGHQPVGVAAVGGQEAGLLSEQKRIAEELDWKLAQRTRELHAVTIELERARRQIDELKAKLQLQNGALREGVSIPRGGLAPWQARRARELLDANLDGKLLLSQLAEKCGLSTRHFARAFRQSMGVPPHRWLLSRRVERAKDLLRDPMLSLAEVALACGFADQSHFTRMFTTLAGLSPGLWRRTASWKQPLDMASKDLCNDLRLENECPTRTVGPSCRASTRQPSATASSSAVSGFCTDVTFGPVADRRGTTSDQQEASANNP